AGVAPRHWKARARKRQPHPYGRRSAASLSARPHPCTVPSMLREVTVEGFKAVRRATLDLGEFTLLIGRNGAGKSSVLEAIQWLQESLLRGLGEATASRYRKFHDLMNRRSKDVRIDLRFARPGRAVPVHYEIHVKPTRDGAHRPIVHHERCVI